METALAGVAQNDAQLLGEAADLVYHLVVLLHSRGLSLEHCAVMGTIAAAEIIEHYGARPEADLKVRVAGAGISL